ncbi:MAG: septal ring lytic transglycosylase RlpA family protein, partial [Burkholderiales bacterium]|nr:septal ring lytic transglycosylase RlpA family protein [Burkholderiales bacterium]
LRDGGPARPPPALAQVGDAVPRVEPLRVGGPNKPYEVAGQRYVPMTTDAPWTERGGASWYGRRFDGQPTASGEIYDMYAMTAAHRTLPIPSYVRVRNPANGREVVVRVNDRGPFAAGRIIDLSYTAAAKLGLLGGVAPVEIERLTFDDIRSGRWQRGPMLPGDDLVPGDAPAGTVAASAGSAYWLQLGAFRDRATAEQAQRRWILDAPDGSAAAVVADQGWYRVQAGPYATRDAARAVAGQLLRQAGRVAEVVEGAAAGEGGGAPRLSDRR